MLNKILLFIPMYNCEKQIVRVLKQVDCEILKYIKEVIVINNRSTDNGENAAIEYCKTTPELPIKILRNDENYGLGGSHKVAFQYAINNGYDYIIVLHGDDQGRIADFIPLIESGEYEKHDCCLGARFMKGSKLIGYNKLRIWGNYGFNLLFSMIVHKSVKDLGSGLNMYKVDTLKSLYFMKYPDTLYFNDLMILASCYYKQDLYFYPISWREEDQISNNKLWSFSCALLKMLWNYVKDKKKYIEQDMRIKVIEEYTAQVIYEQGETR
ncbi:MAG: glycosyltransferase family 2 protein [Lachnospiraceae bacterium]|nr:glycosyltransferase family 2 protein [Lachnospiraceae bacterium]